jgi:integrase
MATVLIQKRTSETGRVRYGVYYKSPLTGERKYYKTYYRLKDARKAENRLRNLIDNGELSELEERRTRLNPLSFSEVCTALRKKWQNRNTLSPKTLSDYQYWLSKTEQSLGSKLFCELRREDVERYRDGVAALWTNITANRHLFVIKQACKEAIALRAALVNPAADILYLSEKDQQRNRFLYPEELDELLQASRKVRAKYLPALICLGAEHGASRQEALSLTEDDVNFDSMGKGMIRFFRTKNRRERTEFLMPGTKQELEKWLQHRERMRRRKKISSGGSKLIFSHLDGSPIQRFDAAWRKACLLAGIGDFRFHDLRHTFCSNLLIAGAGIKDVKDMIGHHDISMTDRYTHLALERKLILQERLAEHYEMGRSSREDIGKTEKDR